MSNPVRARGSRLLPGVAVLPLVAVVSCVSGGAGPSTSCAEGDACVTGTVKVTGFTATPAQLQVSLFREFPGTGSVAVTTHPTGDGETWAFSGLDPWAHYYVEALASFGQPLNVATIVGPISVPSTGPVAIQLKPAQLAVLEQAAPGQPMQLQSAEAFLFDPATGAPLQNATVTIAVGGAPVPMAWTNVDGTNFAYFASFAKPPAAQATYTITSTPPGGASTSWQLVANPPTFTPSVTTPANGATVPVNQPLPVSWTAQPEADEELVQLYSQQAGGTWSKVFEGAKPDDADVTSDTVPGSAVTPSGQVLLLNVSFVKGSCPSTADGCVVGEVIVPAQLTAQ